MNAHCPSPVMYRKFLITHPDQRTDGPSIDKRAVRVTFDLYPPNVHILFLFLLYKDILYVVN